VFCLEALLVAPVVTVLVVVAPVVTVLVVVAPVAPVLVVVVGTAASPCSKVIMIF
jgi:hypothetical protein